MIQDSVLPVNNTWTPKVGGLLSKLWSPFGSPKYWVPYYFKEPKRDHSFDNHPMSNDHLCLWLCLEASGYRLPFFWVLGIADQHCSLVGGRVIVGLKRYLRRIKSWQEVSYRLSDRFDEIVAFKEHSRRVLRPRHCIYHGV